MPNIGILLSYKEVASTPGIHRAFYRSTIPCNIVAIRVRGVDGNNLIDRKAGVSNQGNGDFTLDIAVEDQLVPVLKAILPAFYLSITAPCLIDAGTISDAALWSRTQPTELARYLCLFFLAFRYDANTMGTRSRSFSVTRFVGPAG
jgi:hypothetical protein